MKQKKQIKKLVLNKATIAKLDQLDESKIQGGVWLTYWCSNSCSPTQCPTQCPTDYPDFC